MRLAPPGFRIAAVALLLVIAASRTGAAARLGLDAVGAWSAYVSATEGRIQRELASPRGFLVMDFSRTRPRSGRMF